jgi:hypothetical protein
MNRVSSLTLPLDLGILGELDAEITYTYWPGFPGTRNDPPEEEHIEIEDVALLQPEGESPWPRVSLLPWIEPDTLSDLEQRTLERLRALAEGAYIEEQIDKWEERERAEQQGIDD